MQRKHSVDATLNDIVRIRLTHDPELCQHTKPGEPVLVKKTSAASYCMIEYELRPPATVITYC